MEGVWYSTVEAVKGALNYQETARNEAQVKEELESASRTIEGEFHRIFYPLIAIRHFNWPNFQYAAPWRIWLDDSELISATEVKTGTVVIPSTDYFLEPTNLGPPFTHIDLNVDTSAVFGQSNSHQQDIQITGLFGFTNREAPAGTIVTGINDSITTVDVSDSSAIGIGTIIRVEDERMIVTAKRALTTAQTLTANVADNVGVVTIPVTDGTAFNVEEVILVDAERMRIVDIAANNLIVKRNWDGSVLASHLSGATVFAPRRLTVERGALGTTAAAHLADVSINKFLVPGAIGSLSLSQTIVNLVGKGSAFGAIASGTGEQAIRNRIELITMEWDRARAGYGRKARIRAI